MNSRSVCNLSPVSLTGLLKEPCCRLRNNLITQVLRGRPEQQVLRIKKSCRQLLREHFQVRRHGTVFFFVFWGEGGVKILISRSDLHPEDSSLIFFACDPCSAHDDAHRTKRDCNGFSSSKDITKQKNRHVDSDSSIARKNSKRNGSSEAVAL